VRVKACGDRTDRSFSDSCSAHLCDANSALPDKRPYSWPGLTRDEREDASETLLVEVRKILIEIRTAKQRAQKRQPRTLRTRARTQKKQQPTFGSTQPYFYVSISVYEELTQSLRLSFAKTKNAFEMIGMRRRLVTLLRGRHFRVLRRFGERQRRK